MSIVLFICFVVVIILAVILFAMGKKAGNAGRQIVAFVIVIILAGGLLIAHFMPPQVVEYKVVYINSTENTLTLLSENGKAKYVDLDKVAHTGSFTVDGTAIVVESGLLHGVEYIAPQN